MVGLVDVVIWDRQPDAVVVVECYLLNTWFLYSVTGTCITQLEVAGQCAVAEEEATRLLNESLQRTPRQPRQQLPLKAMGKLVRTATIAPIAIGELRIYPHFRFLKIIFPSIFL